MPRLPTETAGRSLAAHWGVATHHCAVLVLWGCQVLGLLRKFRGCVDAIILPRPHRVEGQQAGKVRGQAGFKLHTTCHVRNRQQRQGLGRGPGWLLLLLLLPLTWVRATA